MFFLIIYSSSKTNEKCKWRQLSPFVPCYLYSLLMSLITIDNIEMLIKLDNLFHFFFNFEWINQFSSFNILLFFMQTLWKIKKNIENGMNILLWVYKKRFWIALNCICIWYNFLSHTNLHNLCTMWMLDKS